MKRRRLFIFGALASMGIVVGAWTVSNPFACRLQAVELERPSGERFRTEDPTFLRQVGAWHDAIEGPSLRQRWLRFTGRSIAPGLRQPDYEVTLVYKSGHREGIAVWVYAKDYVPVWTARWSGSSGRNGYFCVARGEPFTAFAQAMHRSER